MCKYYIYLQVCLIIYYVLYRSLVLGRSNLQMRKYSTKLYHTCLRLTIRFNVRTFISYFKAINDRIRASMRYRKDRDVGMQSLDRITLIISIVYRITFTFNIISLYLSNHSIESKSSNETFMNNFNLILRLMITRYDLSLIAAISPHRIRYKIQKKYCLSEQYRI